MVGDGYTTPLRCEFTDIPYGVEPDSGPYFCGEERMEIAEKFESLKQATKRLKEAEKQLSYARAEETATINEVNKLQKEIDEIIKKSKKDAPSSSDWHKSTIAKY